MFEESLRTVRNCLVADIGSWSSSPDNVLRVPMGGLKREAAATMWGFLCAMLLQKAVRVLLYGR